MSDIADPLGCNNIMSFGCTDSINTKPMRACNSRKIESRVVDVAEQLLWFKEKTHNQKFLNFETILNRFYPRVQKKVATPLYSYIDPSEVWYTQWRNVTLCSPPPPADCNLPPLSGAGSLRSPKFVRPDTILFSSNLS